MLRPAMSDAELAVLRGFLRASERYVEFGAGGSTVLAATLVGRQVIATDSDPAWLDKVRDACRDAATPIAPELVHAAIGPTAEWGHPAGAEHRALWPAYHEAVWAREGARDADLVLVDGRFRVACALRALLETGADALVAIHDLRGAAGVRRRAGLHPPDLRRGHARGAAQARRLRPGPRRRVPARARARPMLTRPAARLAGQGITP